VASNTLGFPHPADRRTLSEPKSDPSSNHINVKFNRFGFVEIHGVKRLEQSSDEISSIG
jgi:hypothetical protein